MQTIYCDWIKAWNAMQERHYNHKITASKTKMSKNKYETYIGLQMPKNISI